MKKSPNFSEGISGITAIFNLTELVVIKEFVQQSRVKIIHNDTRTSEIRNEFSKALNLIERLLPEDPTMVMSMDEAEKELFSESQPADPDTVHVR